MVLLPPFGMGCSSLGNLYRTMSDAEAMATVEAALARGIRYFDVAPHYGFGLAERRFGMALAKSRVAPFVSTKVGRLLIPTSAGGTRYGFVEADPYEPKFDYSEDGIFASYEASLAKLGLPRVNLLLAHDLGELTHGSLAEDYLGDFLNSGYRAMRRLKETSRIDAIGIGVNEVAICERLLDEVALDVIMLAGRYTLLEQGALALLDRCARQGVQVIIAGPYNSGLLVEAMVGATPHYDYGHAPAHHVTRAHALRQACEQHLIPLPAAALRFPLAHPAVASVVAGLATADQVHATVDWAGMDIPPVLWTSLKAAGLLLPEAPTPH